MTDATIFAAGGFRFLPGGQFSNAIAAEPGFALRRVRFLAPLPLAQGLAEAARLISAAGRPLAALALCELRSPLPLPRDEFVAFNERYLATLRENGFSATRPYPIGRSNLAPILSPPSEVALFAVTFTVPAAAGGQDFFISGKPESRQGVPWEQGIVGGDDVSEAGLLFKAEYVMAELRDRMTEIGADPRRISGAQAYTIHPLTPLLQTLLGTAPMNLGGLTLVPAHPPVTGLAFEVDLRSISDEAIHP